MPQSNQEIYEGLFNSNEEFKSSFPTQDSFEQYISTSPTKLDKIYNSFGTPSPITTDAPIEEPVKKKEKGSFFRSLFSGGKNKPAVEGNTLTPQEATPLVEEPVVPILPRAKGTKVEPGPLFNPEVALDEYNSAVRLDDDAKQEEKIATFGTDVSQGIVTASTRVGEVLANAMSDFGGYILENVSQRPVADSDIQWEPVKLNVPVEVIEKQGRRKLTSAFVSEKQPSAIKAAKSIIEQNLLGGSQMNEEVGTYIDKETKEEKGWPILTKEAKQLVTELSENKDLSIYNPVEKAEGIGEPETLQVLKESRIPNAAKIEEYALMAFKQVAPSLEGYISRPDGSLIATDTEIQNDPRFQIVKEQLTDMVTEGIQKDNFESAFESELRKEFPNNKEIQENGIRALQPEVKAMLENTLSSTITKSQKEFDAYVTAKSVPFLKMRSEKLMVFDASFDAFKRKYNYNEDLETYMGGPKEDFEKDKKTIFDLYDAINKDIYEAATLLQNDLEEYGQTFNKENKVKLDDQMQVLGQEIDTKIKNIAKRVAEQIGTRQKLAEYNAFQQNSLVENMVNAYAAGQADQVRGYSLMLRTIGGGRSVVTDYLEDLADIGYKYETSVSTQWYQSKDENGKKLSFREAIKRAFKDLPTALETGSKALIETARMAPAMTSSMAAGALGGGIATVGATAFISDTGMEMSEGYKNTLAATGDRRKAENVADEIYKNQLGILISYVSDGIAFSPKSLGKISNLAQAARVTGSKLLVNQLGETYQEINQGFGQDKSKSEIIDNKPFTTSFTEYAKENALDLGMAVLPQTLLFGGASSVADAYSQITEEKRAQDAIRLFDELGFTNYIHNAVNDMGRSGALALSETMYMQGQITKEQAEKFQQAAIRLTEFSETATVLAPDSREKSHAIIGLMGDKYEQQAKMEAVTTDQAKDQIKDAVKKIEEEIENVRAGKLQDYTVVTDTRTGRIIAVPSNLKLKKLIAPNSQQAYAFLAQAALGGVELNTQDIKIKELVDKYKIYINNGTGTQAKIAEIQKEKAAEMADAAEKREKGVKDVPTDEEITKKADVKINMVALDAFFPVFEAQQNVAVELQKYKEKQNTETGNINIPDTFEINDKTTAEEIDNFVVGAENHQKVNMAIAQMKSVMPLMQRMFPNAKIVLVKDDNAIKQITGSDTVDEGFFYQGLEETYPNSGTDKVYETEEGSKVKKAVTPTIYLNLQRMTEFTLYHETVHAALLKAFGSDPTLMRNFKNGVATILDKDIKARLDKWLAERNYSAELKDEEYLAQLGAFLKAEGRNIKISMWQQFKNLILTVLNKMGVKSLEDKVNSFYDAKQMADFFNQLSKGVVEGVKTDQFVPAEASARMKAKRSQTPLEERAAKSGMVRFSSVPSSQQAFQYAEEMMNEAINKYGFQKNENTLEGPKKYTDFSRANRMVYIGLDKSINIAPNANLTSEQLLSVTNRLMLNIVFHQDSAKWNNIVKEYSKVNRKIAKVFQATSNTKAKSDQTVIDGINEISSFVYRYTNNTLFDSASENKAAEKIWNEMSNFFVNRPVSHLGGIYNMLSAWSSQEPTAQKQALNNEEVLESIRNNPEVGANEQVGMFMDGTGNLIPSQVRKSLARVEFAQGFFDTLKDKFPEIKIDTIDEAARLQAVEKAFKDGSITQTTYERALRLGGSKTLRILQNNLADDGYTIHYDSLDNLTTAYSLVLLYEIQKGNPQVWLNILKQTESQVPEMKEVFVRFREAMALDSDLEPGDFRDLPEDVYYNDAARKIKDNEIMPYLANILADNAQNYLTSSENNQSDLANRIIEDLKNNFNQRDEVDYSILPGSTGLEQLALLLIDPRVKLKNNFFARSLSDYNRKRFNDTKILKDLLEDPTVDFIVDPNRPWDQQFSLDSTVDEIEIADKAIDSIANNLDLIIEAAENSPEYMEAQSLGYWPNNNYQYLEHAEDLMRMRRLVVNEVDQIESMGNGAPGDFNNIATRRLKEFFYNTLDRMSRQNTAADVNVYVDSLIKLTGDPEIVEKTKAINKPIPRILYEFIADISGDRNNFIISLTSRSGGQNFTQDQIPAFKQQMSNVLEKKLLEVKQKGLDKRESAFYIYDNNNQIIDEMTVDGTLVDEGPNTVRGLYMNFRSKKYGYGNAPSGNEAGSETEFRKNVVNDAASSLLRLFADENISYISFTPAMGVPDKYRNDPSRYRQALYGLTSQRMQGAYAQPLTSKRKLAEIEQIKQEELDRAAQRRSMGATDVPTDEEIIKEAKKKAEEVSTRAQIIPISPVMIAGNIGQLQVDYSKRVAPLNKSQIRQSQAANHQKIKQEVDSLRQQNIADSDIFASLFNEYGYEDMRTSAFGTDFMNASDEFIDKKAEEGLTKYAAEFGKRQTGIRNFLDSYYGSAPLLTLVNQLRQGVLFIDDTNLSLPEGQTTYLFDPNTAQLRSTTLPEGKVYKFADYEIFRALFDAGETSSTLNQIFGPQFRQTIERVLERKQMSSDILKDLNDDARSLKVKRSIDELRELGEIYDDMDATAIVKWLVGRLATGGVEEAVQNIIDRLNKAGTFAELEDQMNLAFFESSQAEDIQALSGLGSFAGRVLRLLRQVAQKPEQILIDNAESKGLIIPPKLKAAIEEASKKKIEAYEAYRTALKTFMNDFNDLNGLALIAAEKYYDDMAFEFARTINVAAIQPGFWSNNLIKASAFGLLSINTLGVSAVSVLEILGRSLNLPSALTRFIVDKYFSKAEVIPGFKMRAQTNPFTKAYWRNAKNMFNYTASGSFYDMGRVMATGQQQNKSISLTDQPSNMNTFRDAHNIVQLFMKHLDSRKGSPLTTEDIADQLEVAMIEVNAGVDAQGRPVKQLQLADSYAIFNTFFRGIVAQPFFGQGEAMLRLMPLGLDRFGANAIAMNSMLTYINLQMENDYANMPASLLKAMQDRNASGIAPTGLPSVPGQPIPNVTMDEVTFQKNMSRLMTGLFATGQMGKDIFETEALRETFFNDNALTRGMSSVRTNLQNKMKKNYYTYLAQKQKGAEGSFRIKAASAASLHLNQMANVAQFAVLPFVKVPSNIGVAVITRGNPLSAMLNSLYQLKNYNEVFGEMKDKYKLDMSANTALTIPNTIIIPETTTGQKIEVEKDMLRLYEAKRKYLQAVGDITASTIFAGAAYTIIMSGAVTSSDDPDKRNLMNEMGLRFSEINLTHLREYMAKCAEMGTMIDGETFSRNRGKAKSTDLKVNLINLGTYMGYGLGFASDLYKAHLTNQNETNDQFEGFRTYFTTGTIFQNMTRTMFKMTPSVKFIEDLLQVFDTKKDWGKDIDDLVGGLIATSGGGFAPSLLGKPLSVSEAQVIQSPKNIEMSKEVDKYIWPVNVKPILIGHLRLSRNGLIFPGTFRSDFYQSGIGTFGEDLTLRRTLNKPNTGAAYVESMLNFFSMRRESVIAPAEAGMEYNKHQNVQSFVSGVAYLGSVYFQLRKDPTDFYKVFNRSQRNSFILTDAPEGERGENVNKPIKMPNDIFRDEARILGSYRYAVVEEYNTKLNNFIEEIKTRKIETPEDKEQMAVEIKSYMDALTEKMNAVEKQYAEEFLLNRATNVAAELERRKILVKNRELDEKQLLIQIGVPAETFENIDLYRWSPSFDKQGRLINAKTSESIQKLKK
jgi:hypothetical protein